MSTPNPFLDDSLAKQMLDDLTQLVQAGLIVVEADQVDDEPRFNLTAHGRAEMQRVEDA